MRLLLDRNIAIWAALDPGAPTEAQCRQLEGANAPLLFSAVSVCELRLKWRSFHIYGSRKGPVAPATVVAFARAIGWELLPLTAFHDAAELAQPLDQADPFDELLLRFSIMDEGTFTPGNQGRYMTPVSSWQIKISFARGRTSVARSDGPADVRPDAARGRAGRTL